MGRKVCAGKDLMSSKDWSDSARMDKRKSGLNAEEVVQKKGPWSLAEDAILVDYVKKHGEGNWSAVQKQSGLLRNGKSCRLRWANHLRPNLKKGAFTNEEERLIIELHAKMGNKWARMAEHLPGRTDNEIKNYWYTRMKRHQRAGLPLYPPDICLQTLDSFLNENSGGNGGHDDRHHHSYPFEDGSPEIPDIVFDGVNPNQELLHCIPESIDIFSSLDSSQLPTCLTPTVYCPKPFQGPIELPQVYSDATNLSSSFSDSRDYCGKSANLSCSEGNLSFLKPTSGAVKSELPSLQTDIGSMDLPCPLPLLGSFDDFIQSSSVLLSPDHLSPHKSEVLDAFPYEGKDKSTMKVQSSDEQLKFSSTSCDASDSDTLHTYSQGWRYLWGPLAPLAPLASIFSECLPNKFAGNLLDHRLAANSFTAECNAPMGQSDVAWGFIGNQEDISTLGDFSGPDTLPGNVFPDNSVAQKTEDKGPVIDGTALLGGDDSCGWNSMPSICQMPPQLNF